MDRIHQKLIKEGLVLDGVVCTESASFIHGLSNFPPSSLLRYCDAAKCVATHRYHFRNPNTTSTLSLTEDVELLAGHLYVTNKERTICDMILYESNDEFIYDSIEVYLELYGTSEVLLSYADRYRCRTKMEYYINTLDEYLAEL